jgi:PAS domain S-box-containing protein
MHSLRRRFLLAALTVHVVVTAAMLVATHMVMRDSLRQQMAASAQRSEELLSVSIAPLLVERDLAQVQELLTSLVHDGVFTYAEVADRDSRPVARAGVVPAGAARAVAPGGDVAPAAVEGQYHFRGSLRAGGRAYGSVRFGLSARHTIRSEQRIVVGLLLVGAAGIALAALIQIALARRLTGRLERTAKAADRLAAGERGLQLDASGRDEAARLAQSFNRMAAVLEQRFTALEESERRQRQLTEALAEGVVFQGADDKVLECNDAACSILGLRRAQLLGTDAMDARWRAVDADGRPFDFTQRPSVLALRTGRPVRDVVMGVERPDGTPAWISVNSQPLLREGDPKPYATVTSFADITARIEAQQVLAKTNEDLERRVQERTLELANALDAAEQASRAKSDFLSRMSHELRTPLNAILGFAQVLGMRLKPAPEGVEQQLRHIETAGWHLLDLINDVLDLSRIESGSMAVTSDSVELAPLVAECVRMTEAAARAREVTVVDLTGELAGATLRADPTRLRQVVVNLLSNACKYNRQGGRVTIGVVEAGPCLALQVADTGIGMTERQLASLFEPFNRLGAESGGVEGTGIGLVITRRLVELMGGTLEVSSRAGEGSCFTVKLLAGDRPARTAAGGRDRRVHAPAPAADARTLLYVEDNPSNVRLLAEVMKLRPSVRLLTAHDGATGLQSAEVERPDAIVVDIALPGMDGFELCRRLRAQPRTARLPIVALSANAMETDVARGQGAGFDRYFTKPLDLGPFLQWVDEALELAP